MQRFFRQLTDSVLPSPRTSLFLPNCPCQLFSLVGGHFSRLGLAGLLHSVASNTTLSVQALLEMPKAHTFIEYDEGLNRGSMRRGPRKQWAEQTLLPILPMVEGQAMHPNGTQGKFRNWKESCVGLSGAHLPVLQLKWSVLFSRP